MSFTWQHRFCFFGKCVRFGSREKHTLVTWVTVSALVWEKIQNKNDTKIYYYVVANFCGFSLKNEIGFYCKNYCLHRITHISGEIKHLVNYLFHFTQICMHIRYSLVCQLSYPHQFIYGSTVLVSKYLYGTETWSKIIYNYIKPALL